MINLLKKHINLFFLLCSGLFFLITGTIYIVSSKQLFKLLIIIVSYGFIIVGILQLLIILLKKEKEKYIQQFIKTVIDVFFGLFAINNITFFIKTIVFCFGLYFLCNAILNLINCYIYKIGNIKGKFRIYIELS